MQQLSTKSQYLPSGRQHPRTVEGSEFALTGQKAKTQKTKGLILLVDRKSVV